MTIWKMIRVGSNRCKPENNDITNEVTLAINILLRKYIRRKFYWKNLHFFFSKNQRPEIPLNKSNNNNK